MNAHANGRDLGMGGRGQGTLLKAVSRTLLVCIALASPVAQAADFGERLHLRDPLWADAVTPGAAAPKGSHVPLQVVMGLAGALVLSIPAGYAGALIGDHLHPAERNCDQAGCDTLFPWGGALGLVTGGLLGVALGTGLGVALAGQWVGRPFQLGPAIGGAVIGEVLGVVGGVVLGILSGGILLVPAVVAGAIAGSIWLYEASLLPRPVRVAPTVAPVHGGGVAILATTF